MPHKPKKADDLVLRDYKNKANHVLRLISEKKDVFWSSARERVPLELFHLVARRVPAYKDFLRKNKIAPEKIKTFKDLQLVPPVSKKNYLREYGIEKLCWDGSLKKPLVWTSTSGSTGEPFYFPRSEKLDWQASVVHDLFFRNGSLGVEGPTLVIVGFGMGVWIGGLITYEAFEMASREAGHEISILTTGINKAEILKAFKKLSPRFRQTILVGYPPFIKDVLDDAHSHGIGIKKLNLRLIFAAEPFTEKFRDFIVKKAHIRSSYLDTMNIYGTADLGAMAHETPLAILVRRLAVRNKKLFEAFFPSISKTPTLTQYNPLFVNFEAVDGNLLITGDSAIPLVRYSIGDHGGVFTFGEAMGALKKFRVNAGRAIRQAGIEEHTHELPFVYVYERSDFSTNFYGIQIYPEMVRDALIDKYVSKFLTGRFTMLTKFNDDQDQYLEINLELRKEKKTHPYLKRRVLKKIVATLREKSSEFRELSNYLEDRSHPRLIFWQNEHPLYFRPGVKQKWVKT
ncbi:MAG: hypothetical protein AAB602_00380 [Patescibacteria group bacterium]